MCTCRGKWLVYHGDSNYPQECILHQPLRVWRANFCPALGMTKWKKLWFPLQMGAHIIDSICVWDEMLRIFTWCRWRRRNVTKMSIFVVVVEGTLCNHNATWQSLKFEWLHWTLSSPSNGKTYFSSAIPKWYWFRAHHSLFPSVLRCSQTNLVNFRHWRSWLS